MRSARAVVVLLTLAVLGPACLSGGGSGGDKNSPGTVQFSAATSSVGESGGIVAITVTRTGGSMGVASVLYSVVPGTAVPGQDYTVPPGTGTLIWSDGDAAPKTIDITILNDALEEENETVLLNLAAPGGTSLGTPASTTLTIVDDDSASPSGTLRFDPGTYTYYEGVLPLAAPIMILPNQVTVTRTGGSTGAVSVMVVITGGTATPKVDYTVFIPGPLAGVVLSWADGESGPRSFVVDVLDDALTEGKETILLALTNVAGGALLGSPKVATITIEDDESLIAIPVSKAQE